MHTRSDGRRTVVERIMGLLIDSGVVYTAIWVSTRALIYVNKP